ncbi:hypothetical protein MMC30_000866 [Trapelia coarctata]|nr:hypothetical protein [Trapelia coarctata]
MVRLPASYSTNLFISLQTVTGQGLQGHIRPLNDNRLRAKPERTSLPIHRLCPCDSIREAPASSHGALTAFPPRQKGEGQDTEFDSFFHADLTGHGSTVDEPRIPDPNPCQRNNANRASEKPSRPFKCNEHKCTTQPFRDQAGLLRHRREVHKVDPQGKTVRKFPCPETGCARHKRGFGRQWNMVQHFRRRPIGKSTASPNVRLTPAMSEGSDDSDGEEDVIPSKSTAGGSPVDVCEKLRAKLVRLEQERDRIGMEVEAVRKVIEVFERRGPPAGEV